MNADLSILIPARNEMFLKNTIDDILSNIQGKTEIIVVLDGQWPVEPLPQHDFVTVIYNPVSIGQRAAQNQAARLSTAKYVMKVDAHCSFDQGFDVKMMAEMQDDWTMVPRMYNLHVFDWVCECGHRLYQGPTPEKCEKCGGSMQREIIWRAKKSPETDFMRFDNTLHFQYWSERKKHPEAQGDTAETMSLLGACFMCTREKYWELEICDEGHGSWGQQGTEVACKTWLSGGRLVVNKKTWFAHMFRTQGGDFGFPYPNPGVEKARAYSRDLWLNDKWPKAIHPLKWLIDKFQPPSWEVSKGILYYTDNRPDERMLKMVRDQIRVGAKENRIVSVSLKPIDFGDNYTLPLERGSLTMFKQILTGLEALDTDIVFFCEHDVLYHPSHFDFIPDDRMTFYYNTNVWKVRAHDGHCLWVDDCRQVSGLCGYRKELIQHYKERIEAVERDGFSRKLGFEPGTHDRAGLPTKFISKNWLSAFPNVDIRHRHNLTASRWSKDQFRNQKYTRGWTEADEIPGWPKENLAQLKEFEVT